MDLEELFGTAVVAQLDLPTPDTVPAGTPLSEAVSRMRKGLRTAILIEEGERVVGVFTEVDFAKKAVARETSHDATVDELMTKEPETATRDMPLSRCFELMSQGNFRHLPVLDEDGKPTHMLTVAHLIQFVAERFPSEVLAMAPNIHQITEVDGG